jgi:hypothetical protein
VRSFLVAVFSLAALVAAVNSAPASGKTLPIPALVPQPLAASPVDCEAPLSLDRPLRFDSSADPAGFELLRERWSALGIPAPTLESPSFNGRRDVFAMSTEHMRSHTDPHAYALSVRGDGVSIRYGTRETGFDA